MAADERDAAAIARDVAAAARDVAAELRDRKWNPRERALPDDRRPATGAEILLRAAQYRRDADALRAAAAKTRAAAAVERRRAAADREQAARDRADAQLDRDALLRQLAAAESEAERLRGASPAAQHEDREGSEQAMEGWREIFWRVFGVSQNPMMLLDQERRIVALNFALIEALHYSREQMLGSRLDTFYDQVEWESLEATWRTFQRHGSFSGDRTMLTADGDRIKVQYAAHWAHVAGRSLALFVALNSPIKRRTVATLRLQTGETLSARELEVLGWVALGRRAHEIAVELGIAPTTVESHVRTAMRKVGARSQAQLVAIACARGLLDPGDPAPMR